MNLQKVKFSCRHHC